MSIEKKKEKLYFHNYSENELSLLLTDLAKNESLNVNTLLRNFESEEALKQKTVKKGKKISGKAQMIIEQNLCIIRRTRKLQKVILLRQFRT